MIKPVTTISVVPNLPDSLKRLNELAYNLRWAWDLETQTLFRRLDPELWRATEHNPIWLLGLIGQERLQSAAQDPAFMAHLHRVCESFDSYMASDTTWYKSQYPDLKPQPVFAYFSMEFGLAESLRNYSGGLGVLSGDHLKSASDLGLPMVAVGLLYQEGYFHQYLNADGYQQESYPINDYSNLPVTLQLDEKGEPLKISVPMPGRELYAVIRKVQVGRVPLYLLDSNIEDNKLPEDRNLTDRLYGGDRRTRIRQEILMGMGGIRALEALGLRPTVCHMNEGHSAFLALERIRQVMTRARHDLRAGQRRDAGLDAVYHAHAGACRFGALRLRPDRRAFHRILPEHGPDTGRVYQPGPRKHGRLRVVFDGRAGAQSVGGDQRRCAASWRRDTAMWHWIFPDVPEDEVPIGSVTNGIHVPTWISAEMSTLFDRYLDPAWRDDEVRREIWEAVNEIPDAELWRTHERRRERLVAFARSRLRMQLENRGVSRSEIAAANEVLNPDALTIGFARRFATYKRATLIFRDIERLKRLLNNPAARCSSSSPGRRTRMMWAVRN